MRGFETICVSTSDNIGDRQPLYTTNVYKIKARQGLIYKRYGHQNSKSLSEKILSLYGVKLPCYLTSCGMSAIKTALEEYRGKKILVDENVFFESKLLLKEFNNITFADLNVADYSGYDLIFCEPLSNPLFKRLDIKKVCEKAHSKGGRVLVDNTLLSLCRYNPFKDGVDYVCESLSKWFDGHGDAMGGVLIGMEVGERLAAMGNYISPMDSYLIQRGLSTLPLRLNKQLENAKIVLEFLKTISNNILFDERCPLITFCVGDRNFNETFARLLRHISWVWVFGQVNTTIQVGYEMECYAFTPPYNNHMRLSVGIEKPQDIIDDLRQAYYGAKAYCRR